MFIAQAKHFTTSVTVNARHYMGIVSINGVTKAYRGGAATGGNEIGACASTGSHTPEAPVDVDPETQIHATATEGILYFSP